MTNHEPTTFKLWIGAFFREDEMIFFEGGRMVYEMRNFGNHEEPDERIKIQTGQEKWLNFWDALERIDVLEWKLKYVNTNICDGIPMETEHGDRRQESLCLWG